MIILIIGAVITGLACALAVRFLGGNVMGGFAAGIAYELILTFVPLYYLFFFPFAHIFVAIAVLALLVFFLGKLDPMKSIIAAVSTYAIAYVVGVYILPMLVSLVGAI